MKSCWNGNSTKAAYFCLSPFIFHFKKYYSNSRAHPRACDLRSWLTEWINEHAWRKVRNSLSITPWTSRSHVVLGNDRAKGRYQTLFWMTKAVLSGNLWVRIFLNVDITFTFLQNIQMIVWKLKGECAFPLMSLGTTDVLYGDDKHDLLEAFWSFVCLIWVTAIQTKFWSRK